MSLSTAELINIDGSPVSTGVGLKPITANTNFPTDVRVTTFPEEGLSEIEFKKKDISIENHAIVNTQDFEENGYPVEGRKGGPLSWFTNGYAINSATPMNNTGSSTPYSALGIELDSAQVNIQPDIKRNQDVKNETSQTNEEEFDNQPGIRASTTSNQRSSIDSDSDVNHVARLWRRVADETVLLGNKGKRLEQMQYDLIAREGRIRQLEPYLGLAKITRNGINNR